MKYFLYAAFAASCAIFTVLQSSIDSLDQAFIVIEELHNALHVSPSDLSPELSLQVLDDLKRFVENDLTLDDHARALLLKKITDIELLIPLPTRAPRFDAPQIHATTIIDDNYYEPRDLYLRNLIITGSLIVDGQQIPSPDYDPYLPLAGGTMTGDIIMSNQTGIVFDDAGSGSIKIQAPTSVVPAGTAYTAELPASNGSAGQVLTTDGNNPALLSWQPVTAIVTATIQLFGDVIGSTSATVVSKICGVNACNLVTTITTATSGNVCGTLVMRDANCNFSANLITATVTNALLSQTALYANSTGFAFTSSIALSSLTSVSSTYFTGQLYGDVVGTQTATRINTICGVNACNLVTTITTATSGNVCGTLVMRDANCNFSANLITATVTNALLSQTALYANTTGFAFTSSTALSSLTSVSSTYFTGQLYGDVVGTQTATHIVSVCGVPACNLINSYSQVLSGTSADIPLTLVLRDSTGSFAATNITVTTVIFEALDNSGAVSIGASTGVTSYEILLPSSPGAINTVLTNVGGSSPQQLQWTTITSLVSGTVCDYPNTIVARDGTGSFAATSIALGATDGVLLTYPSTLNACSYGNPFLSSPGIDNLFLGQDVGLQSVSGAYNVAMGQATLHMISSGSGNTALGYGALSSLSSGSYNTALGYHAGSSSTGTNNIYIGAGVTGGSSDSNVISIGVPASGSSGTYINGIYTTPLTGVNPFVGITAENQLGIITQASITTLTITQSLYVDSLNGAVIATNGLLTATIGIDGTRLASFPLTDSPAVNFYQPIEPSRESYFFDDFIAFNASAGGVFYGDTPWVISNNMYPSRVTSLKSTNSAIGVVRLLTSAQPNSVNYLIKEINPLGSANGIPFGLGPVFNEWRVSLPALDATSTFTACFGIGDNPTALPNNGIYFSYTGGAWQINTAFGGTTTQPTNPLMSPALGVFQRLAFLVDAAGDRVDFFIDDTNVGTISMNIPSGVDSSPFASIIQKGGSISAIDLDYWYFHYTFNQRR